MKVHPTPIPKKRNITLRYGAASGLSESATTNQKKKLRRLPHIFAKVLELPFHSDADVSVQETHDSFLFAASTADDFGVANTAFRAHIIEICPGVIKIVVRASDGVDDHGDDVRLDELELDMWRFRLPESTKPEMASAAVRDGELVVVVPKGMGGEERLVFVQ